MVALITRVMREDESIKVTPSAMLKDIITGELREVDILVETATVGRKVSLGIECRDSKRRQSVQWVEEMHAKNLALPVNKTVLVSSKGFTKAALKKAAHYGMDTIVPGEVTPGFIGSVVNNLHEVLTKRAHFKVKTVRLQIQLADGHAPWVPAFADSPVYTQDGTEIVTVGGIVRRMLDGNPDQQAHLRSATEKDKFMNIRTNGPTSYDGNPLYVIPTIEGKELPLAPILGMYIEGPVKLDLFKVPLTHGDYDGMPYSSGSTPFEGMRVSVVATEGKDGTVKWAGSATKAGGPQEWF